MESKRLIFFLLIILILGVTAYIYPTLTGNIINQDYYPKEQAILTRVIDGDTIEAKVNGEIWKIRLLGINTPEKNMPQSQEAMVFLRQFENRSIQLLRDREDTDKYSRKLRYLIIDNINLDIKILEKGLANAYYTTGLIYEKQLLNAEKEAREKGLGIWTKSEEKCAEYNCIILKKLNPKEEFFTIKNSCSFTCNLAGWFVKDLGRNTFYLSPLQSDEERTYSSKTEVWNNDHDRLFIFDSQGKIVLFYEY
jgi:endonuclease YncB( thermonuclease family)